MRYTHTNINARDWKKLSRFYQKVFQCKPVPPTRNLNGEWFEKATGIEGASVKGEHLALPGYTEDGPSIEIFTHEVAGKDDPQSINDTGFAHIAFLVEDVEKTYQLLVEEGGSSCGEIVSKYYESMDKTLTMVYAKDPEGNVVEIQKWS